MPREISHIAVGIIYHPSQTVSYNTSNHIINVIDEITRCHPKARITVAGDFKKFREDSLRNYHLKQVVTSAARQSAILNKVYTSISSWYERMVLCGFRK